MKLKPLIERSIVNKLFDASDWHSKLLNAMNTYVCTLILPDGKKIVARARANSLDEEVNIEWSGATDRLEQAMIGNHSVGFLRWYLQARAQQLGAQFEFLNGNGSPTEESSGQ